jgi:hypothetical protein
MKNAVKYKDWLLAKNSESYVMWEKKEFLALDKHLKMLNVKEKELMERYGPKVPKEQK